MFTIFSSALSLDDNNEDFRGVGSPGRTRPSGKLNSIYRVSHSDITKKGSRNFQFFIKNLYS
jgi:hypothetical protein